MRLHRRQFIAGAFGAAGAALAAGALPPVTGRRPRFRAIAFDGFPILDPRPVFVLAQELFPERGPALVEAWKTRQFEYMWLRAAGGRYADFWQVTNDALVFAARATGVELGAGHQARLMAAWLELKTWPEVLGVLRRFRAAGIECAFLSNFSPRLLAAAESSAGLDGLITRQLSTEAVRSYKPAPRAYQLAVDAFARPREEILFVAFAGWDVAGAKWFGYPTFWVNRLAQPAETLDVAADGVGRDLLELEEFVFADVATGGRAPASLS